MAAQGGAAQAASSRWTISRRTSAAPRSLRKLGASEANPPARRPPDMYAKPIYVIDGARTPFLKSKNRPGPFAAGDLATQAGRDAARAAEIRAAGARRGDPRLRRALGGRGEHRPRRGAAHGLRREGAGLDGDAQLRLRHAGARLRHQQHPRRPLEPGARRRRGRALARAAALQRQDGELVLRHGCGPHRPASAWRSSRACRSRRCSRR